MHMMIKMADTDSVSYRKCCCRCIRFTISLRWLHAEIEAEAIMDGRMGGCDIPCAFKFEIECSVFYFSKVLSDVRLKKTTIIVFRIFFF